MLAELRDLGVEGEVVRVVDHGVRFGVSADEGDGDGWPAIRQRVLAADILVLATPIWKTRATTRTAALDAAHLARLLRSTPYPAP